MSWFLATFSIFTEFIHQNSPIFMSSIGEQLIKYRKKIKLTQQDVADRLNIKTNTYGSWESDKTQPAGKYFPQLAEVFGVTLDKLFPEGKCVTIAPNQTNNDNSTSINAQEVKMEAKQLLALAMKGKDEIIVAKEEIISGKNEVITAQRAQIQTLDAEVARLKAGQG
jgi:transcriptional regulator with XRE-family HTH domain